MAIELNIYRDDVIDLATFRKAVIEKVDPEDPHTLQRVAGELVALANNRELLMKRLKMDLQTWRNPDFAMYSAQSAILDRFGVFSVRVNFWLADLQTTEELSALSYNSYHDHNFDFITTNVFGPGYSTSIFEYSRQNVKGEVGESVEMVDVGEVILSRGKVLVFRNGIDIHSQRPPLDASASLNLIINSPSSIFEDQYYFDVQRKIIIGMVENASSRRINMLGFGAFFSDEKSIEALTEISESFNCQRTRTAAREVLRSAEKHREPA